MNVFPTNYYNKLISQSIDAMILDAKQANKNILLGLKYGSKRAVFTFTKQLPTGLKVIAQFTLRHSSNEEMEKQLIPLFETFYQMLNFSIW